MRGLKKPRPPNDVSPDGQLPRSLQTAEHEFLKVLAAATDESGCARSTFNSLEKTKLRAVLYIEQGELCVYCERRIAEGQPAPRIDHWRPLGQNPKLALHWRNLYLSCANPATCDCRKHESPLRAADGDPDLPWPVDHAYEHCVDFTSLGEMYVRSDAPLDHAQREALRHAVGVPHNKVTKDNGILNLNHPALVAARAASVDSERDRLERRFKDRTASRFEREAIADERLRGDQLPEFVSIRVGWLRKMLGKGR
jgi:uncharacterized protein (TIGR02646 family)